MEKILEMAKDLGYTLQEDARFLKTKAAQEAADADEALQQMIGEFNLKRMELNSEMSKPDKDRDKLTALDGKIKELYGQIMANKNMAVFNNVKNAMDELLSQINMIITMSANGEDPATCSVEHSCGGNCSSCGGCH